MRTVDRRRVRRHIKRKRRGSFKANKRRKVIREDVPRGGIGMEDFLRELLLEEIFRILVFIFVAASIIFLKYTKQ